MSDLEYVGCTKEQWQQAARNSFTTTYIPTIGEESCTRYVDLFGDAHEKQLIRGVRGPVWHPYQEAGEDLNRILTNSSE